MASLLNTIQAQKTMVTRFKSARQKQALSHQEQTIKTLTQLLKKPNITVKKTLHINEVNITKKVINIGDIKINEETVAVKKKRPKPPEVETINSPTASVKPNVNTKNNRKRERTKSPVQEAKEFYPGVRKRKLEMKKIMLKPKHFYKVVATTNKRKRRIPHRELKSPPLIQSPTLSGDLTMEELVRLTEADGLDDEDFLEILTCPSPVWWEDMENDEYRSEDNTPNQDMNDECDETPPPLVHLDEINNNPVKKSNINLNNKQTNKFIGKKSKLENVLDSIKCRKHDNNHSFDSNSSGKARKYSSGGISDASINEEELLNSLENLEIPVQKIHCDVDDTDPNNADLSGNVSTILDPDDTKFVNLKSESKEIIKEERVTVEKYDEGTGFFEEIINRELESDLTFKPYTEIARDIGKVNAGIPTTLPPLTKNPFSNKKESPKSIDSLKHTIGIIEFDSISDTNIKFLDEYEDEFDKTTKSKTKPKNPNEYVTVYKILSNETENVDVEEQIKANLVNKDVKKDPTENATINSFYKKCKNTYINKNKGKTGNAESNFKFPKPVDRENEVAVKYKNTKVKKKAQGATEKKVPNTDAKYCHKCSSIFDTSSCQYCVKKVKRRLKARKT